MVPPESPSGPDDQQYEDFYGLSEQPFAISTDPRFLFLSASHQRAYQELLTGLQRHEGLMLLTGEAGTGKTTLCRGVIQALGERTFSAILLNPYMSGAELLKVVLKEFGLVTREELRRGALARAEPPQLLDAIEGFLLSVRSIESRAVIVVDEAQSLSPPVLDQVRLLTALERQGKPLLQIIIGGQPKLIDTLRKDSMYALSERITRRVHLAPLLADEIQAYITHRLTVAGGGDQVTFLPEATTVVAELSRGLPRRVNLLCDRALQEGRADQAKTISAELVRRAARSLAGTQPRTDAPTDSIADGPPPEPPKPAASSAAAAKTGPAAAPVPPMSDFDDDVEAPGRAPSAEPAERWADEVRRHADAPNRTFFDMATPPGDPDPSEDELAGKAAADELIRRFKDADTAASASPGSAVMFGADEAPQKRRRWWVVLLVLIALTAGAVYGYFLWTTVYAMQPPPQAPDPPRIEAPPVPEALPVPDDATVAEGLEQFRLLGIMNANAGGGAAGAGS